MNVFFFSYLFWELFVGALCGFLFGSIAYGICGLSGSFGKAMGIFILLQWGSTFFTLFLANLFGHFDLVLGLNVASILVMQFWSGYFVPIDQMPEALSWIRFINMLTYGWRSLMINEFKSLEFDCDRFNGTHICYSDGKEFLDKYYGIESEAMGISEGILALFVGLWVLCLFATFFIKRAK
jgi:ABC-type multidrug transport system permease subunit